MMEMWAGGGFSGPNRDEMYIRNAAAQGYCNALQDILEIDYQIIEEGNASGK